MQKLKALSSDRFNTPVEETNWKLECNKLREQVIKLKIKLEAMENPVRSPEQLEKNMQQVRAFITSMSLAEGAVTCANLYNRKFFTTEKDMKFVSMLCTYLVSTYKMDYALIEDTFALWKSHAL